MLIIFRTRSAPTITMFGEVGTQLLKMMGQSGVVPGAIVGTDVARALANLRIALRQDSAGAPASQASADQEERDPPIALSKRAGPLLDLLERAARAGEDVVWESNQK
jgi:Domain of unknown function (DUF1840)